MKKTKKSEPIHTEVLRAPKKGGRPRLEIDPVKLEKLCSYQCTMAEIASFFDISVATLERRAREPEFREFMERGYAKGRVTVRRIQMQLMESGNATMAIWLGKQLLGQRDRQEMDIKTTSQYTLEELLTTLRDETIGRDAAKGARSDVN